MFDPLFLSEMAKKFIRSRLWKYGLALVSAMLIGGGLSYWLNRNLNKRQEQEAFDVSPYTRKDAKESELEKIIEHHRVNKNDLPEWAKIGRFRFSRLDGGPLEAKKAELSGWHFSDLEKESLFHLYDKHSDKIVKLLKGASINWVWITYSNGFSLEYEKGNRELLREFIKKCHDNRIKVAAYISMTNMFWEHMFREMPKSRNWVLIQNNKPVLYYGIPTRFFADINNKEWREFMKKRTSLALDDEVDAIFYDNTDEVVDKGGIITFVSEVQELAEGKRKKQRRKNRALIYLSPHERSRRLKIYDVCDAIYSEFVKFPPGIRNGKCYVDNIRKIKYIRGAVGDWKPHQFEIQIYSGRYGGNLVSLKNLKLSIAEGVAFRSSPVTCLEGTFLKGLILDEEPQMKAWDAVCQYNTFLKNNEEYYVNTNQLSNLAVLVREMDGARETINMLNALIKENVMFDILEIERLKKDKLLKYRAILVPDFSFLNQKHVDMLDKYKKNGGKIYFVGRYLSKLATMRSPKSMLHKIIESEKVKDRFLYNLHGLSNGPIVKLEDKDVIVNITKGANNKIIMHFLNYSPKPKENLRVMVDLKDCASYINERNMRLFSPDYVGGKLKDVSIYNNKLEFVMPLLDTYNIVVIYS